MVSIFFSKIDLNFFVWCDFTNLKISVSSIRPTSYTQATYDNDGQI